MWPRVNASDANPGGRRRCPFYGNRSATVAAVRHCREGRVFFRLARRSCGRVSALHHVPASLMPLVKSDNPQLLSEELRNDGTALMLQRRSIVGLSMLSAFRSWCLTAAASTFGVLPAVLPELRAAVGTIRDRR